MKTTVEIADALLDRARRQARRSGRPVRALIEEGLRLVLHAESGGAPYTLRDCSVGDEGAANPLESLSWQDLCERIYEER